MLITNLKTAESNGVVTATFDSENSSIKMEIKRSVLHDFAASQFGTPAPVAYVTRNLYQVVDALIDFNLNYVA